MSAPLPISAVIITLNGAKHLADTLACVGFCDERLVFDSGSTDATLEIASAAGARVEHQAFLGYGLQKQRAVQMAAHDWILSLDDDEILDVEAIKAIHALDLSDPAACWSIRRRTFIGTRELRHGTWGADRVVRLFHRRTAGFTSHIVHERVRASRPTILLPGSMLHLSYDTCSDVIARSIQYARLKSEIMRRKKQRVHTWMLPLRAFAIFSKSYFLQGGFRDGAAGFIVALSRVIDSTLPRVMLLLDEPACGNDGIATPIKHS